VAERDGRHPLGEPERACITRHRQRSSADRGDRAREPPRRCGQACWRARPPACCGGASSIAARSKATSPALPHSAAAPARRVRPARYLLPRLEILPRIVRSTPSRQTFALLRACSERPGRRRAAEQRDELTPSYVEHGASSPALDRRHQQMATSRADGPCSWFVRRLVVCAEASTESE
jgi:hypothetical protein